MARLIREGLRSSLLRQPHSAEQVRIARIRAQNRIHRITLEPKKSSVGAGVVRVSIRIFEPVKGAILVSGQAVEFCKRTRHVNLVLALQLFDTLGYKPNCRLESSAPKRAFERRRQISKPEKPSGFFQLLNGLRVFSRKRIGLEKIIVGLPIVGLAAQVAQQ